MNMWKSFFAHASILCFKNKKIRNGQPNKIVFVSYIFWIEFWIFLKSLQCSLVDNANRIASPPKNHVVASHSLAEHNHSFSINKYHISPVRPGEVYKMDVSSVRKKYSSWHLFSHLNIKPPPIFMQGAIPSCQWCLYGTISWTFSAADRRGYFINIRIRAGVSQLQNTVASVQTTIFGTAQHTP